MRAIETADTKREILSEDDRLYASRSARELANWQAADRQERSSRSTTSSEQRAEQILKRLAERTPAFRFLPPSAPAAAAAVAVLLPLLGFLAGAGLDRIGNPHRVDLLSAPLLLIIGWNLLVYLILHRLGSWSRRSAPAGPAHACCAALASARRRCRASCRRRSQPGSRQYMADWSQLSCQADPSCASAARCTWRPPRSRWAPSLRCTRAAC
jgi:hypothetical protein